MLQVENISFSYRRGKKEVLHDFSLSLERGRVYGLLGKNGAGKSTLLYLMSGLLTPKSGKIMYHDTDVRRRLPITLQDMFLVPEEFELPPISLVSYVELNSQFYPRFSKEDMVKYLHYFEMEQDIDLGALSMGQKKKVFMSFALATHTSLLIMDEPTNGLDIPGKSQFRKFIASGMSDDRTIIISTHQVRDIDKILDHVVIRITVMFCLTHPLPTSVVSFFSLKAMTANWQKQRFTRFLPYRAISLCCRIRMMKSRRSILNCCSVPRLRTLRR